MSEQEQAPPDGGKFDPSAFDSLEEKDGMATLSWYLVVIGIFALGLAALCFYLDRTGSTQFFSHRDFALNPRALGRYLLYAGILCYAAGRIITYYRRFRKRPSG